MGDRRGFGSNERSANLKRILERRPRAAAATREEFDDHPSPSSVVDGYEAQEVSIRPTFPSRTIKQTPDISFTASASYLPQPGDKVELIWKTRNADEVSISPDVGAVTSEGRLWVTVWDDTTYTLTATNKIGDASNSIQVDIDKIDKPLDDKPKDEPEELWSWIKANPTSIRGSGEILVTWEVDPRCKSVSLVVRDRESEETFPVKHRGVQEVYVKRSGAITIVGVGETVKDVTYDSIDITVVPLDIDIPDDKGDKDDEFVSERPRFVVDRRPVAAINTYGGQFDKTPTGQAPWFYEPGGVKEMLERKIYPMMDIGFERFMMWLPAGSNRQRYMASSQWGPLPEYRKLEFQDVLGNFLEEYPEIDFGIYMGYKIHDPFSLRMPERELRIPDLSIDSDRYWFRQTIQPWVDIGANWFFGDTASAEEHRDGAVEIADMFSIYNLKYGGEALPTTKLGGGEWDIDEAFINEMPWCCLHFFSDARDKNYQWRFDPHKSEVGIIFSGHSERRGLVMDFDEIEKRVSQGYIPWCMLRAEDERTPFIYELGQSAAKLDKDRLLDENDVLADETDVTSTPETE